MLVAALLACLGGGFALRARQAAAPASPLSTDDRAYGRIAIALGTGHGYGDEGIRNPYQWAPGAPALFAVASRIGPASDSADFGIPSAYWAQAIVGTLLIGAAFALAALLAGGLAGLAAAAAVAFYPPLVQTAGHQLSEPLGALLLTLACAALARASNGPRGRWLALAGVLFGLMVLTRADLLLTPLLAAVVVAVWLARGAGALGRVRAAAALLVPALLVIVPWIVVASLAERRVVPVSDGGSSALYVGTYLPGGGTIFGLKREFARETRRRVPDTRQLSDLKIPAEKVLRAVAARHPELPPRVALRRAAMHNLSVYGLGHPGEFASMMLRKAGRMWSEPTTGEHPQGRGNSAGEVAVHRGLLAAAVVGLLAGLWRRRDPVLLTIAAIALYSTLDNMILIAEARHGLPLLPVLFAAGAAGWALALRGRAAPAPPAPAPAQAVAR
jgi:hypothetical protein